MRILPNINIVGVWDHYFQFHDIESRNTLLIHYLYLVKYAAEWLYARFPRGSELDDMHSAGIFGLLDAIIKFKPAENVKFEKYGVIRIFGAIRDDIRKRDWVPRLVRSRAKKLQQVTQRLETTYGRYPTEEELTKELGMNKEQFCRFRRDANFSVLISLNANLSDPDVEFTELDVVANNKSQNPYSVAQSKEFKEYVKKGLSREEQLILILFYYEEMTMKEIGTTLGLSESRVCQLHSSLIARLRNHVNKSILCS